MDLIPDPFTSGSDGECSTRSDPLEPHAAPARRRRVHGTPTRKKSTTGRSKKWLNVGWLTMAWACRSMRRMRAFFRLASAMQSTVVIPRDRGQSAPSM